MYTLSEDIRDFRRYFDGYRHALIDVGIFETDVWSLWLSSKYGIWDSESWGWERILLYIFLSDKEAIRNIYPLFCEFIEDVSNKGEKCIIKKHEDDFRGYISKTPTEEIKDIE